MVPYGTDEITLCDQWDLEIKFDMTNGTDANLGIFPIWDQTSFKRY